MMAKINTESIKEYEHNPRTIPNDKINQLNKSISQYGFVNPIVIWEKNNTIISGHQRFNSIKDQYEELFHIPIGDIGLVFPQENIKLSSEEDVKALNIALNKIEGEFDFEELSKCFQELEESEFDVTLTGFTTNEVKDIEFIYLDGEDFLNSIPTYVDDHLDLRNSDGDKYFDDVAESDEDDENDLYFDYEEEEEDSENIVDINDDYEEELELDEDLEHSVDEEHSISLDENDNTSSSVERDSNLKYIFCRRIRIVVSEEEENNFEEQYNKYVEEGNEGNHFLKYLLEEKYNGD